MCLFSMLPILIVYTLLFYCFFLPEGMNGSIAYPSTYNGILYISCLYINNEFNSKHITCTILKISTFLTTAYLSFFFLYGVFSTSRNIFVSFLLVYIIGSWAIYIIYRHIPIMGMLRCCFLKIGVIVKRNVRNVSIGLLYIFFILSPLNKNIDNQQILIYGLPVVYFVIAVMMLSRWNYDHKTIAIGFIYVTFIITIIFTCIIMLLYYLVCNEDPFFPLHRIIPFNHDTLISFVVIFISLLTVYFRIGSKNK